MITDRVFKDLKNILTKLEHEFANNIIEMSDLEKETYNEILRTYKILLTEAKRLNRKEIYSLSHILIILLYAIYRGADAVDFLKQSISLNFSKYLLKENMYQDSDEDSDEDNNYDLNLFDENGNRLTFTDFE